MKGSSKEHLCVAILLSQNLYRGFCTLLLIDLCTSALCRQGFLLDPAGAAAARAGEPPLSPACDKAEA